MHELHDMIKTETISDAQLKRVQVQTDNWESVCVIKKIIKTKYAMITNISTMTG